MKEKLDELVRICKEREIVEKIARKAKEDPTARLLPIYEAEKKSILGELQKFKEDATNKLREDPSSYVIDECKYVTTDNVLQICIICMMTGIDDYDLLENDAYLKRTLNTVEGEFSKVAENIAEFLAWGGFFTNCETEDLLEEIFG